jgi:hypothetical protein
MYFSYINYYDCNFRIIYEKVEPDSSIINPNWNYPSPLQFLASEDIYDTENIYDTELFMIQKLLMIPEIGLVPVVRSEPEIRYDTRKMF